MSKSWEHAIPFFGADELACQGTGVVLLDIRFAIALPALRYDWGRPMSLSSCCRTPEHNRNEGGHPRSLHLTENPVHSSNGSMACDILWYNLTTDDKMSLCQLAWRKGWAIGLNDIFLHIDRRADIGLAQNVFTYGSNWSGLFGQEDIKNGISDA